MLIVAFLFFIYFVLPQLGLYAEAAVEPVMTIIIALAGIVMLFGAVGFKISENLGSTVTNGLFRAIGALFRALGWIIRFIFRLLPRVFTGSRRMFIRAGLNEIASTILAAIVVAVII